MRAIIWKILFAIILAGSLENVAFAEDPSFLENIPKKYDLNGDGLINKGNELSIYLTHQNNAVLAKYDKNIDGVLSQNEVESLNNTFLNDTVRDDIFDAEEILGDRIGFAVASSSSPSPAQDQNPCHTSNNAILLRSAYFAQSIFGTLPKQDADSLKSVTPATFSFSRDNLTDTDVFTLSGAVSFVGHSVFKNCNTQAIGALKERAYSAGVVFDRSSSSNPEDEELDSLVLNLNADYFFQDLPIFSSHYLTGSAALISDFGFDSAVLSTSINWQPSHPKAAIGVAHLIGDLPFSIRWQPRLKLDFQSILDSGDKQELLDKKDSLFLSPSISAQLFLESDIFADTFIDLNYQHMEDLLNSEKSFDFFEASLNIPLDISNHFLFQARYREGNLPSSRQDVDDYLLGIGVRF